jgi:beta-lactamase regulating signal transducer with metallopeptidase domain
MIWLPVHTVAQMSIERILNALPEGFLVALFAWALLRVLRRQNSETRFAVWFVALLAVAALPVMGGFGEGWTLMAAGTLWGSMRPAFTIPGSWALFVFLAWALGAGAALLRLAAGLCRLRQLRRSCTPIVAADLDPAVRRTVDAIGASKSVASRSVTITTSECVRVPAAIGFFKRTIVLPAWALRELQPEDLNVILLHEFAHLRRWDDWTNLIQKVVRALFFFHPAVWWIESRLSVEREMACDDAVLAETANPHGYATCLVSLLEKSLAHRLAHRLVDKRWSMVQAAVNRAREASLRLARILDINRPVARRVWKPALAMVAAFSMVCLMAVPLAPQFVAFDGGVDRSVTASNSHHPYSAAVSPSSSEPSSYQSSLRTAAVIPAALRTGEPSSVGTAAKMTTAKVAPAHVRVHDVAGEQIAPARVVAVRLNAAPPRDRVVEASASADQEIVPQFRTLVFIEATQYVTFDSSVWSVQVWRVMWVSPVGEGLARVPVAHSI